MRIFIIHESRRGNHCHWDTSMAYAYDSAEKALADAKRFAQNRAETLNCKTQVVSTGFGTGYKIYIKQPGAADMPDATYTVESHPLMHTIMPGRRPL